jgi:tetratricopeptide (TPR) repeat protein
MLKKLTSVFKKEESLPIKDIAKKLIDQGDAALAKGSYDDAIAAYGKAIVVNGTIEEAHLKMGLAYFKRDFIDKAIECFEKAIYLNSEYADAYFHLGNAFYKKKNLERALRYYQKAANLGHSEAKLKV